MIKPCTFNFRAQLHPDTGKLRKLPWDALTEPGQTVKVIYEDPCLEKNVHTSSYYWNSKMFPRLKVKRKIRATTFAIYEVVQPDVDSSQEMA